MPRRKRRPKWIRTYAPTGDYETCPDCSMRDAISFTHGYLSKAELEGTARSGPVVSWGTSHNGMSLTRGCESCGGTGIIRRMRDTAIPAAN